MIFYAVFQLLGFIWGESLAEATKNVFATLSELNLQQL